MSERKVAFISGGANGIGKAIAIIYAKNGYDICLNDLNKEALEKTGKEIEGYNVRCLLLDGDVTDEKRMKVCFDKVDEEFHRLDVLVNNAGICPIRKMDKVNKSMMEKSFDINLVSMFVLSKLAYPIMKRQGEGLILNAASQSSFRETPVTFEYTLTKWGIRGMTKAMAMDLKKDNIRVNAYCPGTVITDMQDSIAKKTAKEMHVPAFIVRKYQKMSQPLGRFQTLDDIANLVFFLSQDDAKGINGQCILCNGGQVMN